MSLWVTKRLLLKEFEPYVKKSNNNIEIKGESINDTIYWNGLKCEDKKKDDGNCKFFLSMEKLCRLCESAADVSVFRKVDGFDISSAIQIVTNITVKKEDWYPKYICVSCLKQLKAAFVFKIKCQQTDMKYRQLAGMETVTTASAIRHDFTLLLQKMAKGIKVFKRAQRKTENQNSQDNSPIKDSCDIPPQSIQSPPPPASPPTSVRSTSPQFYVEIPPASPPTIQKVLPRVKRPKKKQLAKAKKKFKRDRDVISKKNRSCIKCDAVFTDEEKFREHYNQSACKRTQCPQCEKMVLNLRIHTRRMHPSGVVFKCQHCDKSYPIMSVLQRHMLVHTNNYDFPCTLCSYRGKRKEYLKIHMRSHGAERYLCSECPATFINQSNFNKHRLIHGSKKYQCEKCKKSFRYAKLLQVHDEAQHQKIQHPCSICGQIFKYRSKLLKHELKVHNRTKRKLNEFTTAVQLLDSKNQNADISSVDNVPMETYLQFKKDNQGDGSYYSRNFEER